MAEVSATVMLSPADGCRVNIMDGERFASCTLYFDRAAGIPSLGLMFSTCQESQTPAETADAFLCWLDMVSAEVRGALSDYLGDPEEPF